MVSARPEHAITLSRVVRASQCGLFLSPPTVPEIKASWSETNDEVTLEKEKQSRKTAAASEAKLLNQRRRGGGTRPHFSGLF